MIGLLSILSFGAPWVLLGLVGIPLIWIMLRAIPPAPIRRIFPAVVLLLGIKGHKHSSDKTPWWLLLLRSMTLATVIIGMAGPMLNKQALRDGKSNILIILDGSWASAQAWSQTLENMTDELSRLDRQGVHLALLDLSEPESIEFKPSVGFNSNLMGLEPKPYDPDWGGVQLTLRDHNYNQFDTIWFSDGLGYGDEKKELLNVLQLYGNVSVYEAPNDLITISGLAMLDKSFEVQIHRLPVEGEQSVILQVEGVDLAGNPTVLAAIEHTFLTGDSDGGVEVVLPSELRKRIKKFSVKGQRHAGASFVLAHQLNRPEAAIVTAGGRMEMAELLTPTHYIESAISDRFELLQGAVLDILPANPDIIFMADIASVEASEEVVRWVEKGGTLVRFAGPRLATAERLKILDDPLMPVMIRQGGRRLDGAMSWGSPKKLALFPVDGPFAGLKIPSDLRIYAQVLAEPGPDLSGKVIASLQDGTPLVTRNRIGLGQVVLIHVTANAEWSNLPLSGLFPKMLERLAQNDAFSRYDTELGGQVWVPVKVLDGFGRLNSVASYSGVSGESLIEGRFDADMPPGLYQAGERRVSRNLVKTGNDLIPMRWPSSVILKQSGAEERNLSGLFLSLTALLMMIDLFASLWLSGQLRSSMVVAFVIMVALPAHRAHVETLKIDKNLTALTEEVVLAHVLTGNKKVDEISAAGLDGLSRALKARTSVEPTGPVGVNLESDELAFFPLLYWPVTSEQPRPSPRAYSRINTYLRSGGVILFDTRDGDISGSGNRANIPLVELTRSLDIPRLEPVPIDHVLTRAFYLISDFPGRYRKGSLWVQADSSYKISSELTTFRPLNDGVTPILIGGNDWASAWAVDETGRPNLPVGRGYAGERQREMAYRFGVNLIMYALTGNYKSDQVHVPALLDRLGK